MCRLTIFGGAAALLLGIALALLSPSGTGSAPTSGGITTVTATYQPFERGFMVRRGDQDCVYSFAGNIVTGPDGIYHYCVEYAGLPDDPYTGAVPEGLTVPGGPFGRVWKSYAAVREQLGFATGPEQSYTGQIPPGGPIYGGGPFEIPMAPLPDGRVLYCGARAATAGTCSIR